MEMEHQQILVQARRKQALMKLETLAGLSHTVRVLRLKLGHLGVKKGVEDVIADLLDAEIEKLMTDMIGDWDAYKHTASDNSTKEVAPDTVTNVAKTEQF